MKKILFALIFLVAQVSVAQVTTNDIITGNVRIQTRVKQGAASMIPADTLLKVIRLEAAKNTGGGGGVKLLQPTEFDSNGNYTITAEDKHIIISEGGPIAFLTPQDDLFYTYAIDFIAPNEGFSDPIVLGNPDGVIGNDKFILLPSHRAYVRIKRNSSGVFTNMVIIIQ